MSDSPGPATAAFIAHRNLLFTVAYEMLGSAADSEDVLQETWMRWVDIDLDTVRDHRAYLVRITTRQALNRLRTLGRRKENYVGPWLPEPILTTPDIADDVELADSVSTAMLLVLETLVPTERAVFVLRDVFDFTYDEIAEAVDKTPAAVRQIAHRARTHVASRKPRATPSPTETRAAMEAFQYAAETGELDGLLDILAPDIVVVGDGGGIKQAMPKPVIGAKKAGRLVAIGIKTLRLMKGSLEPAHVNGHPALFLRIGGKIDTVISMHVEDGLIKGVYSVRNPEKLARIEHETSLSR